MGGGGGFNCGGGFNYVIIYSIMNVYIVYFFYFNLSVLIKGIFCVIEN